MLRKGRNTLVAARALHPGQTITADDLALKIGGLGIDALYNDRVLGCGLCYPVQAGDDITFGFLQWMELDAVTKTTQLDAWTGAFGQAYLQRNGTADEADMGPRTACWSNVMRSFPQAPASILEVGSNIGKNLAAFARLSDAQLHAVEPFADAFSRLEETVGDRLTSAHNCTGFKLPFADNSIDFVFTSGVLIHIAPADLPGIMSEVVRVSKRYVLCNEYFAKQPEEINYRGENGLLFKRDFGRYYTEQWPSLKPINTGFFWLGNSPFDDTTWWLFEKV